MKKIIVGTVNYVKNELGIADEEIEKMAKKRMDICKVCEHKDGIKCGVCHCVLALATRSPKKRCPKDKW